MAIPSQTTIYGKIISNSSKNLIISRTDKIIGIKYPIEDGKYFTKSSGVDLVKSEIKNLIKTIRGERFMLPDYGCNLKRFVMEPIDEILFNEIKNDIQTSISKYLVKVNLNKIQVFSNNDSIVNVKLFCSLKDDQSNNFIISI